MTAPAAKPITVGELHHWCQHITRELELWVEDHEGRLRPLRIDDLRTVFPVRRPA